MMHKNVLLLEAGAARTFIPSLPILGPMWQDSPHDWKYLTEPQEHACKALNNRQSRWPRGKVFGGTHLLSNLIHMKGDPEEYRAYFSPLHKYDYDHDIGQYFQAYEDLMDIQPVPFESEFSRSLLEAGSEIDFDGFHQPNVTMRNGFRFTTAGVYQDQQQARANHGHYTNHTLMFNAMVNRLVFSNGSSAIVEGVEFEKGGVKYVAMARKAVILSAGAIGSPAILLRSGIGPKADLEPLGIDHHLELPVGRNLMDHVGTGLDLLSLNSSTNTGMLDIISMDNLYNFVWQDKGLIALPGCDLVGRLRVLNSSTVYDLELMVIPVALNSDNGIHLKKILNIRDDTYSDYFYSKEGDQRHSVTILPVVLKPKSVGELKLRSRDPKVAPIINPKYLSHPEDMLVLLEGIKFIRKLVETKAMQKLGAKIKQRIFPGCEAHEFDTDDYWRCYIGHVTMTSYHPGGTCSMGSCTEDSVVDFDFKVHGTDNLFVVDASVMPELPAANPIATINMLAISFANKVFPEWENHRYL